MQAAKLDRVLYVDLRPPELATALFDLFETLARHGLEVVHTGSLERAIPALHEESFDAVILDLGETSELRAVSTLRAHAPDAAILVLMDDLERESHARAVLLGAQDAIAKVPLVPERLEDAVRFSQARRNAEQQRARLRHHDILSGLPSRVRFEERIRQELAHSVRRGTPLAVLMVDIDGFRKINQDRGYGAGDTMLCETGIRLQEAVRSHDFVARFNNDRFAVLVLDMASNDQARLVSERILSGIERPVVIGTEALRVSASIGIALYPKDGDSSEALIRAAEQALETAKRAGGRGLQFHSPAEPEPKSNTAPPEEETRMDRRIPAGTRGEKEVPPSEPPRESRFPRAASVLLERSQRSVDGR